MDFTLNEEQQMFKDTCASLAAIVLSRVAIVAVRTQELPSHRAARSQQRWIVLRARHTVIIPVSP